LVNNYYLLFVIGQESLLINCDWSQFDLA